MKQISNDKELAQIFENGVGFVFNDYSKTNAEFNKLHRAGSSCLNPNKPNRLKVEGSVRELKKFYFETREDANKWLKKERSDVGYSDCHLCMK